MNAPQRRWFPTDADYRLIWAHLERQRGLNRDYVRLDTGEVVRVGGDAESEGDDDDR